MAKLWLFIAGLLGALAVAAGAIGTHALRDLPSESVQMFEVAQRYQALHALGLAIVGAVLLAAQGRRAAWSGALLNLAAVVMLLGIVCFSGGLYLRVAEVMGPSPIIPFGGSSLIASWLLFAAGALGIKGQQDEEGRA